MSVSAKNIASLIDMTAALRRVDDETWGFYAFSADFLNNLIPDEKKREMIRKAIECGEDCADRVVKETGESSPGTIARRFGLEIVENDFQMTGNQKLFARFTPPKKIEIFQEPLKKYEGVLAGVSEEQASLLISLREIYNLVLGHEIYHYMEECNAGTIYSRAEKYTLWRFFGFHYDTTVNALGEIAGMAFSRKLNHADYSPFLLDVLLFFGYDFEQASAIFQKIMHMKNRNVNNLIRNF
jgi:hypothetical protein